MEELRVGRGWRYVALTHAIHAMEAASGYSVLEMLRAPEQPCAALAEQFNLGDIIDFSDAIGIWEAAAERMCRSARNRSAPHDQKLFHGRTASAPRYFRGISNLALRNAPQVCEELAAHRVQFSRLLDLGAGTGDYAAALIDRGLAKEVLCVDYQYVVDLQATQPRPGLRWHGADLRRLSLPAEEPFGALWISNVLHHYSPRTGARILRSSTPYLRQDALLLIHEYLLDAPGTQALAAAMLGLHFALTTNCGRCYSTSEILDLSRQAGFDAVEFQIRLPISTVLILRRSTMIRPA